MNFSALVLAGGESRRMGQDKAWLEFEGRPLLARAVATLKSAGVEEILISGRPGGDYSRFGCPVLFDLEPGFGPVGGIERGLQRARFGLVIVLAVDLPRVTPQFLRHLKQQCDPLTGAVPEYHGKFEPLAAIYPKRCHALTLELMVRFERAARAFAAACFRERAIRAVPVSAAEAGCLENWNAPADLPQTARSERRPSLDVTAEPIRPCLWQPTRSRAGSTSGSKGFAVLSRRARTPRGKRAPGRN
jgi:molybdopterin-guanine dinucleotide biosynthesis protein A